MMCMHCAARVEKALNDVKGVKEVKVDLEGKCATVRGNDNLLEKLRSAVTDAGYEVK
jgi:Copper chaperone